MPNIVLFRGFSGFSIGNQFVGKQKENQAVHQKWSGSPLLKIWKCFSTSTRIWTIFLIDFGTGQSPCKPANTKKHEGWALPLDITRNTIGTKAFIWHFLTFFQIAMNIFSLINGLLMLFSANQSYFRLINRHLIHGIFG